MMWGKCGENGEFTKEWNMKVGLQNHHRVPLMEKGSIKTQIKLRLKEMRYRM